MKTLRRFLQVVAIAAVLTTAGSALGQFKTWDGGGGNDNWTTGANWVGDVAPSATGEHLTFAGNTRLNPYNNNVDYYFVNGIRFDKAAGAFTLAGNRITLYGNIDFSGDPAAAITQTINLDMAMNFRRTITTTANGSILVGGVISDSGPAYGLTKAGAGTLTLNGLNTFSGQALLTEGTVSVNSLANAGSASSLGDGVGTDSIILLGQSGTSVTLRYTGNGHSTDRQISIGDGFGAGGTATLLADGTGAASFTASTFNTATNSTATRALVLGGSSTADNTISGAIVNNHVTFGTIGITKQGVGKWILAGNNTYRGTTTVNEGTLLINGNNSGATGAVTVANGATLGGKGTVGGATTINGTVAPGESPGVLTFAKTLTLGSSAKTLMEIDGIADAGAAGGFDKIVLSGSGANGVLTYGGALTLDIGTTFDMGTYSWDLFDFASETGTFGSVGLADQYTGNFTHAGSGVWDLTSGFNTWQFTESSGVLNLTVVPEPSTLALLAIAGVVGGGVQLRRYFRRSRHEKCSA